jgi:FlaA1/EpsC-like NDP-sugar epimerase
MKLSEVFSKFSFRKLILAVADSFIIVVAALLANFVLLFSGREISQTELLISFIMSVICTVSGLFIFGAYAKMWRYFDQKDYFTCVYGAVVGFAVASLFYYLLRGNLSVPYVLLHFMIALAGICLFRYLFRNAFVTLVKTGRSEAAIKRTMIIGAGQTCKMILQEIESANQENSSEKRVKAPFEPICIIDDDRNKVGTQIMGVEVVGTSAEIFKFVEQKNIEQIIFAIPSCLDDERQRVLNICSSTKLPIKIIPFIGNLIFDDDHDAILSQLRDIKVEDLLGREPITFDNKEIKGFITGKVCMVTGGGGSIGSELVRQIARYTPEQIIIVDIYENNAYEIQQELKMEYGDSLNLVVLIASVRDYFRMNQIFKRYKPQIVFHAAAHKHVPLMEASPMEAIKNNVIGTFNTATLAQFHDVEKFVMISTDKAVNPTNVMGASKRCCEMIVQYLCQHTKYKTEFVTTRFGNVLGSNGSVIPLFKKQIEQGKPVTVTHPDIIRYFMTIPEAVSLVLEAASMASGGEIFVLDMGKPVRIVTLAENLIRMYGKIPYKDVEIRFTGLRPGEKIREELLMDEEGLKKTDNKLIFIGNQIDIDPECFIQKLRKLKNAASENDEEAAVQALHDIVPTFVTPEEFNQKELVTA